MLPLYIFRYTVLDSLCIVYACCVTCVYIHHIVSMYICIVSTRLTHCLFCLGFYFLSKSKTTLKERIQDWSRFVVVQYRTVTIIPSVFEICFRHYKEIMHFVFENIDCHAIAIAFDCTMQRYYKTENKVQVMLNVLIESNCTQSIYPFIQCGKLLIGPVGGLVDPSVCMQIQ